MSAYETLAIVGLMIAFTAIVFIVIANQETGSPVIAAVLSAGFASYSAVTIANEGLDVLWANHTQNLWGVQVWWDLLLAIGVALFFIAPRARRVGMNVPLWTVFIIATASIALLAMAARLFWLEREQTRS